MASIAVAGCSAPNAISPMLTTASQAAVDQQRSLDSLAYDRAPVGAIALPTPSSPALPVTQEGNGRMIGDAAAPAFSGRKGTIVLNLVNVPLQQAAKTVLGDMIGVNYVVDPRVDGTISVQTTHAVDKADALELFQAALAPIGASLVQNRNIYRIVPADQSATGTISTGKDPVALASRETDITGALTPDQSLPDSTGTGGNGVRIVQLKYVAASEVARVLEPMVPKNSIVQADDGRNILALKGSPGEINSMLDTIAVFDVDVMRGMSFAVVPVKSAQPEKLASDLKAIFASDREGPLKGRVRFVANAQLASILVITSQPKYLPRAKEWIRKLDAKANGSDPQLHVYEVQNRPAAELAGILQSMFSDQIKVSRGSRSVSPRSREASLASAGSTTAPAPMSAGDKGGATPASAVGGDLRNLARALNTDGDQPPADPMADSSTSPAAQNGAAKLKIVSDDAKNSLLIMANDRDYQRVYRVIQGLDVIPSQVLISAVIAEVTLTDDLRFGVQYALSKGGTPTATFSNSLTGGVAPIFPGFNYAITAANIAATLSTLSSLTHVNVISTPSLMVLDNKPARLQIGDQVPITTQTATSTVTANAAIVNSVSMQDTGVILSVIPRINESGRVQLEIEQEVSAVVPTTTSNIDSPTIQQRRVRTTVVVNDGEVLALGGMIQNQTSRTTGQIPLLGSLPGIGPLFANKDNSIHKTELIILITPRVVRDGSESRLITEEYRRRMRVFMPHEAAREPTPFNTLRRLGE